MKDNALYLEADEDITSAIDKLTKAAPGTVQIVVPKRSTMLQSIINLKLLKKAAESNGKELVLVTGDRIATELAARVGLAVAPSIGANPVIGEADARPGPRGEEVIEANDPEPSAEAIGAATAVSAVASDSAAAPRPKRPILKRHDVGDGPPGASAAVAATPVVPSGKSMAKIPSFKRMQRRLMWAGLALVLIVGYMVAMYAVTNAQVTLYAIGTKVDIDTSFTADPSLKQTDTTQAVLAAQQVTVTKDLSGPFTPTGKKDIGTTATGTVSFQNCEGTQDYPLAKGNVLSSGGLNFITTDSIDIPPAQFSHNVCTSPAVQVSVVVTAEHNGDNYNLTNAAFTCAKLTSFFKITGSLTGGTSKIASVVTQSDVNTAKAALIAADKDNSLRDLQGKVISGYMPLPLSQTTSLISVSPSPAVDAEGSTGTLTEKVAYTMLSVKQNEYQDSVRAQEQKQIGDTNQIYQDGITQAQITAGDKDATGRQTFHLTTVAFGGAKIDKASVATSLKGKRYGDAADLAARVPGVSRADIIVWPGWATSLPSRPDKIHVTIQVNGNK